jgi:hypothetical protein
MLESGGVQATISFDEPSHAVFFDEAPKFRIKPAVGYSMLCRASYLIVTARFVQKSSIVTPRRHQIRIFVTAVWALSFD